MKICGTEVRPLRLRISARFSGADFDVDLADGHVLGCEQLARTLAVGTPARGVHDDRRRAHQAALVTGSCSARQPAKPPRSENALVNPCWLSWRTAAAASEPDSS
mgnify:CR=1 FL=1